MSNIKVNVNRLREARESMGFSQTQLAHLIGLKSSVRISQWEKGESIPSLKNAIAISIVCKRLVDDIFVNIRKELLPEIENRQLEIPQKHLPP
ncbi:MAG: helix-turn-helix transcriptional regulator [Flavipsychrobacter sp.]